MLDTYKTLDKQIILSSTLKKEEYELLKYDEMEGIHSIDYSKHEDNKILQQHYAEEFSEILDLFEVAK